MKKRRLKRGVKKVLVIVLLGFLIINFVNSFNKTSKDEIGNTCYGSIIKVCGGEMN